MFDKYHMISHTIFASIHCRNLSDIDKDGKLNCDEFCIAMHLTDVVKMGQVLPAKLPAELLPSKARSGSFGTAPPTQARKSFIW